MNEVRPRTRERALEVGSSPTDLVSGQSYVHVKRTLYGQEEESEERIRVPLLPAAHARVSVGGSVTHNLGDYNSCKVEVFISLPCLPEESEIERVYQKASGMVERYLDNELRNVLEEG